MARALAELLHELPSYELSGNRDLEITNVTYDSRRVTRGSLFVAIPGFQHDGTDYIPEALSRGAAAVATEQRLEQFHHITQLIVNDVLAWCAAGHPERNLRLCGVTGTNGKTTITHLLRAMLEAAGCSVGLIGTLTYDIGKKTTRATRTTPEAPDLAKLFSEMVDANASHCVMEVTSHALTLKRVKGLDFSVAAFSNISRDHLDFHGSFDNYRRAKAMLFENLSSNATAVINIDDDFGRELCTRTPAKVLRCSLSQEADIHATDVQLSSEGITLEVTTPDGNWNLRSLLIGGFNAANVLIAAACGYALGLGQEKIQKGLDKIQSIPGRMEIIHGTQPFTVVVDFAHTPAALENILSALQALKPRRLLVLFGAGGDRDKGKRKEMARVVSQKADEIFLASDNPRSEEPEAIIDDIEEGLIAGVPCHRNANRMDSIRDILQSAGKNDIVLIAGKGAETTQEIQGVKHPFDDCDVVRRLLRDMGFET